MTEIKITTKKGQQMKEQSKQWQGVELYEVYGSYSSAKARALEDCKRKCREENGTRFHITSHNTFGFSVAWDIENENGDIIAIRIETPQSSYKIVVA